MFLSPILYKAKETSLNIPKYHQVSLNIPIKKYYRPQISLNIPKYP